MMKKNKQLMVYVIFTLFLVFSLLGGNWTTIFAQGTVPLPPPPVVAPVVLINSIITAGEGHTCAITPADGLRCWGWNDSGQLGDGTFEDSSTPVYVEDVIASGIIDLTAGIKHTCALFSDSTVQCWGMNDSGQLGNNSTANSNVPVTVAGLQGEIVAINAGAEFTCAQNDAGEVFCWGDNSTGQLNDGTTTNRLVAVKTDPNRVGTVVMHDAGLKELQGVTPDGAANYWNSEPLIPVTGLPEEENEILTADRWTDGGCSTTVDREVTCWGAITPGAVTGADLDRHLLDSGMGHACTLVQGVGMVCWGSNSRGQLGVGTQDDAEEYVVVKDIESVVDLATGMDHSCAIINDELIKCWGNNEFGQLGNGTIEDTTLPVPVL